MLREHEAMKDFDKNIDTIEKEREATGDRRPATQLKKLYQMQFSLIHLKWTWHECII